MKIYKVPDDKRYWVVRADSGEFYNHFIENEVVALGHINGLYDYFPLYKELDITSEKLERDCKMLYEERGVDNRRSGAYTGQVKAFVNEVKIGDWVITIGHHEVSIGRIVSGSYLEKAPLRIKASKKCLSYELRRNVIWGVRFNKNSLPFGIKKTLQSTLTIFNIDKHWDSIHYSLYPYFRRGDKLYLSTKIGADNKIKNYHLTSFLIFLNEIEVIAKENNDITIESFKEVFNKYAENDLMTMTTQAEFHSPGEIWAAITGFVGNIDTAMTYIILGYSMIFGNSKLGFDGVVDVGTRRKLYTLYFERKKENNIDDATNAMKLNPQEQDTTKVEDDSNDQ